MLELRHCTEVFDECTEPRSFFIQLEDEIERFPELVLGPEYSAQDRLNMEERIAQQTAFAAMVHHDEEEDDLMSSGHPHSGPGSIGFIDLEETESMVGEMDGAESVASTGIGLTGQYLRPPPWVPLPTPPAAAHTHHRPPAPYPALVAKGIATAATVRPSITTDIRVEAGTPGMQHL